MTSARRVFDLRRRPSSTLNLVSYVAFRTTEMQVQRQVICAECGAPKSWSKTNEANLVKTHFLHQSATVKS